MSAAKPSYDRAYQRKRHARLRAAGLCVTCGRVPPVQGLQRCLPCQEKARASSRAYLARRRPAWRSLGICVCCGDRMACEGLRYCAVCAEQQCERIQRLRAARRAG